MIPQVTISFVFKVIIVPEVLSFSDVYTQVIDQMAHPNNMVYECPIDLMFTVTNQPDGANILGGRPIGFALILKPGWVLDFVENE